MSRSLRLALACLAMAAVPATAAAMPPRPTQLEPGGGTGWRAETNYDLRWQLPAGSPGPVPPVVAAHLRLRNPLGTPVVDHSYEISPKQTDLTGLRLFGGPGLYNVELWLEDSTGVAGPVADTTLRFDDTRPAPVEPLVEDGWVGRAELPLEVALTHPQGVPPSGIRGYAVAVDRDPAGRPCALTIGRCADSEIDLRGGIEEDTLFVPELSEGTWRVHAVAVSGSGMSSVTVGQGQVRVDRTDPSLTLEGVPPGWANRPVTVSAHASDLLSGMAPDGDDGPFAAIAIDGAAPSLALGDAVSATVVAEGVHDLAYYARDAAGNVADGRTTNGTRNPDPRHLKLRIDRRPPRVFLLGPAGPAEPETIVARVADPLAGPDADRGEIGVRATGSAAPFAPLPTSVLGGELRAHWQSDSYPRGTYEFQAIGYDAAGNSAATSQRVDGAPLKLRAPIKVGATLECGLTAEPVLAASGGELVGRLALGSDAAPRAAEIDIVERLDGGGERRSRARTGADGSFSLWLGPGPSRSVEVVFPGDRQATRAVCPQLRLRTRPSVILRASSRAARVGGRPIAFGGRVDAGVGMAIPVGGLAVELQFRVPGEPWHEFRTLRTDRDGRFFYRYRFTDDDSRGVRFGFRAVAPTQSDWPFEPWSSRPVAVRGA